MRRSLRWLAVAAACAAACSGSKPARPPLVPVAGSVFVDGKPAAGALVTFHRANGLDDWKAQRSYGIVGDDGRFAGTTYNPSDGVPEGEYRLTVVWSPVRASGDSEPDRLRGRYANPNQPAATVTVAVPAVELAALRLTR